MWFFLNWITYVDQKLIFDGNCLGQSKFNLIDQWSLPPHGIYFDSFIGLCSFYSNYFPCFESNIKPLHHPQYHYHCQILPLLAPIASFKSCKTNIVCSLLLLRYDSLKLIFVKINLPIDGMGYILIQPDSSPNLLVVIKRLYMFGTYVVDSTLANPHIIPVLFNSHSNYDY